MSALLLIDAGNTRIKWALADDAAALGDWRAQGAVPHAEAATLATAWSGMESPLRVIAANVAGEPAREAILAQLRASVPLAVVEWFASSPRRAGISNGYRNPGQLGCDRFAAAIGAHALAPGKNIIVANCGTATTIDAVTADGVFLGGMILPGLGLMASSLARNTAQLPQIAQDGKLPAGFADNTDDAILSGILAAQAGAIERAFARHEAAELLISGGAAPYVAQALALPLRHIDNIVLIGLHAAARAG
ncbi:type III pantothenate kinase [Massilia endophytica]|uniref:type III pantothenate kinase n=1 Tax=Massilia endophytica TaxID=2899220 RepID=UPI001E3339E5|nr:type III pantothenate kinase [Massilia endophytica]UGQ47020.1 type III pantothenate kinase [Massilia endophytica]